MIHCTGPHGAVVEFIGSGKPIAGQSMQLFCNVTAIGHPEHILSYVWQRNHMKLKGTNKIQGEMTAHLTVKISICYGVFGTRSCPLFLILLNIKNLPSDINIHC